MNLFHLNPDSKLAAWVLCLSAASLVTAIIYPALHVVVHKIHEALATKKAEREVRTLRPNAPPPPAPLRVRQTDLVGLMTPQDKLRYNQADQLLAAGKIKEAAAMFEAIKFQRRAIDILEQARMIEEACEVLLRLKVPGRAGVLSERNGRFELAAKYYLEAGESGHAAKCFLQLGQHDPQHFATAAELLAKVGRLDECLEAWAEINRSEKVVQLAVAHERWRFLANYMHSHRLIDDVFGQLAAEHRGKLYAALGQTPRAMVILSTWAECAGAQPALIEILQQATTHEGLARVFVDNLTSRARQHLQSHLSAVSLPPTHLACLQAALNKTPLVHTLAS